jgi:membrane fusion protein (multidrug efflux system)
MINARVLIVFGSATLIAACHKAQPPAAPPAPTVQVSEVVQQDVPIYRQWVGSLDGFVNADIRPQVQGYVLKQAYRDGAFVREGDLLFLIDQRNYRDLADQASSTLDRNIAALALARLNVRRDKELIAAQAITQQQLDNDLAAERQAAASVGQSRATLKQAELNHEWTQVTSPISGIAGIAQLQVGSLVSTTSTMTTVSQVDPIKAQFNISETEYLRSAQGNHWAEPRETADPVLELILDDGTVYPQRGAVIVTNRQVSLQTGTIAIQGSFPNPANVLRPGQYAKIRAAISTRKNALLVPQRAINELQGSYQVGVVGADGKFDIRVVQTAEPFGAFTIVDKGVSAGDKVVVSDLTRLRPGMQVRAVPASDSATASTTPSPAATSSKGQ